MQFFKHYHNASTSISIQKIIKEHGLVGYAQWFLLLELLCEKFDGESDMVSVTVHEIANKLRSKPHLIVQCMVRFEGLADIKGNIDNFELIIQCPILLDLQDKDYKYAAKRRRKIAENRESNGAKNKEEREKNKEEREKREEPEFAQDPSRVNFSQVANLFNQIMAGGKIEHENFMQSGEIVRNFVDKQKEHGLNSLQDWNEIFTRAKRSDFVREKLRVKSHLAWILKDTNLKRILRGDFDNNKASFGIDDIVNPFTEVAV